MMLIKRKYRKNLINIVVSTFITTGFSYFILAADKYNVDENRGIVNAAFLQFEDQKTNGYIPLNDVIISDDYSNKFVYIVQPGDSLSSIAYNFGTTVDNLKKTNTLKKESIKPGDKLIISEEEGFIYEVNEQISIDDFAKKYSINAQDLKDINYISDGNYVLEKGEELFLPISTEKAKQVGLIKVQQPTVQTPKNTDKITQNTSNKGSQTKATPNKYTQPSKNTTKTPDQTSKSSYDGISVVSKYYYRPSINNGFYAGHCTRYVAIKKFPYISAAKQSRIWSGNARDWYKNAKNAGYDVGKTPKKDSIVVLQYGGSRYYSYGHVGIVQEVDLAKGKILIEDMNAYGRFVVTKRWIPIDSKIVGYIY